MAKNKTHKGAKKRVRVTGGGKLVRRRAFRSHLLTKKSPDRKRRLRRGVKIDSQDGKRLRDLLGR